MKRWVIALILLMQPCHTYAQQRQRIIDMHLHVVPPGQGRTIEKMLRDMDKNGIVLALLMGLDTVIGPQWRAAAPGRFALGVVLPCPGGLDPELHSCFAATGGWPDTAWIRRQASVGQIAAIGELYYVYSGMQPTDPRLEPYWALAEALDLPVVVHTGRRPRSTLPPDCCNGYDDDLGNPALLGPVLQRHPKLRISIAHAGQRDFFNETLALMKAQPNVYADMSVVNARAPEPFYLERLREFRDAGLLTRIMFGSDNLPFDDIIARTDAAAFLTKAERQDLYCGNAARFLRLDVSICGAP